MVLTIIFAIVIILTWISISYVRVLRDIVAFCDREKIDVFGVTPRSELQLMGNLNFLSNLFSKSSVLSCSNSELKKLLLVARKKFILQYWLGFIMLAIVFINAAIQS